MAKKTRLTVRTAQNKLARLRKHLKRRGHWWYQGAWRSKHGRNTDWTAIDAYNWLAQYLAQHGVKV